jgi:hypothetical protein
MRGKSYPFPVATPHFFLPRLAPGPATVRHGNSDCFQAFRRGAIGSGSCSASMRDRGCGDRRRVATASERLNGEFQERGLHGGPAEADNAAI